MPTKKHSDNNNTLNYSMCWPLTVFWSANCSFWLLQQDKITSNRQQRRILFLPVAIVSVDSLAAAASRIVVNLSDTTRTTEPVSLLYPSAVATTVNERRVAQEGTIH